MACLMSSTLLSSRHFKKFLIDLTLSSMFNDFPLRNLSNLRSPTTVDRCERVSSCVTDRWQRHRLPSGNCGLAASRSLSRFLTSISASSSFFIQRRPIAPDKQRKVWTTRSCLECNRGVGELSYDQSCNKPTSSPGLFIYL